jgi:hypothetical protein
VICICHDSILETIEHSPGFVEARMEKAEDVAAQHGVMMV